MAKYKNITFILILIALFASGPYITKKTRTFRHQIHAYVQDKAKKKMENSLFLSFKAKKDNISNSFYSIVDDRYRTESNLKEYLLDFPINDYRVINVCKQANFFIDLDKGKNDCIKGILINNSFWENHLLTLMKKCIVPGTIVLDIGAHIGTHTINLAKWLNNGVVYAFEPQPKIFRELFYNLALNDIKNVKLFKSAVGATNGKIELSPLIESNEGGTGCHGNSGIFADLITIDSLNLKNVSLIKIDVEGMEDDVLEGARETILRNKPIIFIEFTGYCLIDTKDESTRKKAMEKINKLERMGYFIQNVSFHDYIAYPFRNI